MATSGTAEITRTLIAISGGDRDAAERLMPLVYDRLRNLAAGHMRRQPSGHTLRPTELVHEAYLKLVDSEKVDWKGRTHFYAVGALAIRQILVDHARGKGQQKRGGGQVQVEFEESLAVSLDNPDEVLAIQEAMEELASKDERQAKIVELRFFGGMTGEEIAAIMGISRRTVQQQWSIARAWLRWKLSAED